MSGFSLSKTFDGVAGTPQRKRKQPPPISIRFTDDERALLKREAGETALSTYVREKVLGSNAVPRPNRYRRKRQEPRLDTQTVAKLLGTLGQSELGRSLLALALAAQSGALPVTPELTGKLKTACDDIQEMKSALISALRIAPEDGE